MLEWRFGAPLHAPLDRNNWNKGWDVLHCSFWEMFRLSAMVKNYKSFTGDLNSHLYIIVNPQRYGNHVLDHQYIKSYCIYFSRNKSYPFWLSLFIHTEIKKHKQIKKEDRKEKTVSEHDIYIRVSRVDLSIWKYSFWIITSFSVGLIQRFRYLFGCTIKAIQCRYSLL